MGGQSYFYSFSSGDLLDTTATVTYGLGRIDFSGGVPTPTVLTSGDSKSITVGSFPRNGKTYLYSSKTDKKNTSATQSTTTYTVYDPDKPLNDQISTAQAHDLVVNISNNISIDIALPPDDKNGMIYVIDNNATLMRYDPLTWTSTSQALPTGYDQHKLVSLAPDSWNYLYVWSSKKTNVSADGSYTPVSSDINVYDRDSLKKLATFSNVRTGFDTTKQKPDDPEKKSSFEMGRGLVYIADKFIAFVAYDSADVNSAHIVKIDENQIPTLGDKAASVLISSADIGERNIDIESPMPDLNGGIYFEAYSRDADPNNITTRDSYVFHWDGSTKKLVSLDVKNGKANGELVIAGGTYKGNIMVYQPTSTTSNDKINTYLWNGSTSTVTHQIDNGNIVGVEIEKPFSDGATGLYFMAERKITNVPTGKQPYEADALWWWRAPNVAVKEVLESTSELEVEAPEMDTSNGFYFVSASADINASANPPTGTTTMTMHYCVNGTATTVTGLGTFNVPPSTFKQNPADPYATPQEILQNEFILLSDNEYDLLFAGAGPVGGNFKLTVFNYSNKDARPLTASDIIQPIFTDKDMGGYADMAGAQKFTDATNSSVIGSSGGGCDSGFGILSAGLLLILALKKKI
ncbi:MAG: hypothetical protein IJT20_02870 [Synergistaceae bacterium]|nr:hypothetical protein [Synergistaceae bacterium]